MWTQRRANKYSAKRAEYKGQRFDSKGEAGLAAELDLLLRAGELVKVERQKTFELRGLNGKLVARHRVDFLVTLKDGSQEVREFKGMAQEDWRIKRELFIDNFPLIPYVVITARPRWGKRRSNRKR